MKRIVQKNKNKQKQELKTKKIRNHLSMYSSENAYMNITALHLSPAPLEIDIKVPYNFVIRDGTQLSHHEITYLGRASDLLILTIASSEVNYELISLIKRAMPSVVLVYDRKQKNVAKTISKTFGDVKICELSMLNMILEKIETKNTNVAASRPLMMARSVDIDGEYMYAHGFMKNGPRTNKVIINGIHEGVIEEVIIDGDVIPGDSLNFEENESLLNKDIDSVAVQDETDNSAASDDSNDSIASDNSYIEVDDIDCDNEQDLIDPGYDLINKYSEYRGIRNLATCTFKDQKKPEYYKDIVFLKNLKYAQSHIKNNPSIIPKNKYMTLKIRVFEPIVERIAVIFGLVEYETRKTIHNFDFSCSEQLPKEIIIDNGFRVYTTNCMVTRNLNHNVFPEEPDLLNGVVSFVGPINIYSDISSLLINGINSQNAIRLLNGRAQDRLFFDCVELKGKPVKVCKSYVVVRGMFFNKEQVEYFKNIKVESRNGISGFIKKPLGTKGLFKAYFVQPVKHGDSVKMSLYKLVFL